MNRRALRSSETSELLTHRHRMISHKTWIIKTKTSSTMETIPETAATKVAARTTTPSPCQMFRRVLNVTFFPLVCSKHLRSWNTQMVPKRRHGKFRRQRITQK